MSNKWKFVSLGPCARGRKTVTPLLGASMSNADGLEESFNLTVSRDVLLKTHPSTLFVTLREGEERGICTAALKEMVKIFTDQVGERSVVALVLNKIRNLQRIESESIAGMCPDEIHPR